jgi:lipopolysaccharide transport system ATP-binding protein
MPRKPEPSASEPLLVLEGIGKDYARTTDRSGHFRLLYELLRGQHATDYFRALDGITLTVNRGESLGLIGENGAGKSTLLKIIAGVIPPTRGSVRINGTARALLELGSGFHPEYSGLDNIELAGALAGMNARHMRSRRDEIIDFADIGEHIDDPMKTYSSGMVVRLGFAIVTVMKPDLLITDEVLAVGDESFQRKCIAWQESYLREGGTLILCSHGMYHIEKLCRHVAWIHAGALREYGDTRRVVSHYLAYHDHKLAVGQRSQDRKSHGGADTYAVTRLELSEQNEDGYATLGFGADLTASGELYSPDGRAPVVSIGIVRNDGAPVYGLVSEAEGYRPPRIDGHRFAFSITFPRLTLLPGRYTVRAHALDPEGMRLFDTFEREFFIEGSTDDAGLCRLRHAWRPDTVA